MQTVMVSECQPPPIHYIQFTHRPLLTGTSIIHDGPKGLKTPNVLLPQCRLRRQRYCHHSLINPSNNFNVTEMDASIYSLGLRRRRHYHRIPSTTPPACGLLRIICSATTPTDTPGVVLITILRRRWRGLYGTNRRRLAEGMYRVLLLSVTTSPPPADR